MPRKIKDVTKDYLVSVPLPVHGDTYTVISHQSIIDYAYAELANQGFGVVDEEYRCNHDGQIAQGIYRLQYNSDPELSIMFAWTNSYNKQIKFKCATGAYIHANQTVMLSGDMGSYTRKHTGTADADTVASMQSQITNANKYYDQLVQDKESMKSINLSSRKQAELLGILFAESEIINTEQASIIRQQMHKPSYFYNGGKDTLWSFYNHVTLALQQAHPKTWMEDQRMLHWVISNEFDLGPKTILIEEVLNIDPLLLNPGQTNILDQIADMEADQMDEDARYASFEDVEIHETAIEEIIIESDNIEELAIELELAETTFMNARELELQNELEEDNFAMAQLAGVKVPEEIMNALMNAPEIDASEIDMSEVTWVAPDVAGNFTLKEVEPIVVQEGSDFDIDLHQSEEIILEVTEDKSAFVNDEIVTYTDVAGNTFIVPVVVEDFVSDEEEDMIMDQILIPIAAPTLEPTPEEHALFEAEEALYVVPLEEQQEADLDLKEAVAEVKEDNSSDFDLDFGSNDLEDDGVDNTPDFF